MKKISFGLLALMICGNAFAVNSLNCTVTQQTADGEKVVLKDSVLTNQHKTSQINDISLFMSNKEICAADGGPCILGAGETILILTIGKISLSVFTSQASVTDQTLKFENVGYQVRCLVMPAN